MRIFNEPYAKGQFCVGVNPERKLASFYGEIIANCRSVLQFLTGRWPRPVSGYKIYFPPELQVT